MLFKEPVQHEEARTTVAVRGVGTDPLSAREYTVTLAGEHTQATIQQRLGSRKAEDTAWLRKHVVEIKTKGGRAITDPQQRDKIIGYMTRTEKTIGLHTPPEIVAHDIHKGKFRENIEQLQEVERRAQFLRQAPRPLTAEEKSFLESYNRYQPVVQQLLKIATHAGRSAEAIEAMARELEANQPSRAKEAATGAGTMLASGASFIGHPFVQVYELVTGKEIVTMKDSAQAGGEGWRYLTGQQTQAWEKALGAARTFEAHTEDFYRAWNAMVPALSSERPEEVERATQRLMGATERMQQSHQALASIVNSQRAELEQLNGFTAVSGQFVKDAVIEVTLTVTMVGGLKYAFKAGHTAIPQVAKFFATKGAAEATAVAARAEVMAVRGAVWLHRGEEALHAGHKAHHVYHATHEIDETAGRHADVPVQAVPGG